MRCRADRRSLPFLAAFSLAASACLLSGQPAGAQSRPTTDQVAGSTAADEAVWLEFAWPVGLSADVDMEQHVVRGEDEDASDVTTRSRFRMTVRDHPRGLAVDLSGARLVGFEAVPPVAEADPVAAVYRALAEMSSTYIVTDDGMLLDVEGLERGTETLRRALEPVAGELGERPGAAAVKELLAASLSVDALEASAADLWASLVWFWAWEEFRWDSVYTFTADVPSPAVSDLVVPMAYEVGFLRMVPCYEGAAPDSCVHLEARTSPDTEAMATFMGELAGRLAATMSDSVAIVVDAYEQENSFAVTLEPSSMIPHEFRMSRRARVRLSVGGRSDGSSRLDEVVLRFRYATPLD